jgi:hypothetical protein
MARLWRLGVRLGALPFGIAVIGIGGCDPFPDLAALREGNGQPVDASTASKDGAPPPLDATTPGPVGRFCESHSAAILCEDFDGPSVDAGALQMRDGTAVAAQVAGAPSPPNALVAQVGAVSASGLASAYLSSPPLDLTTRLHCAFDVAVLDGDAQVFKLEVGGYQSELLGDSMSVTYQEFADYADGGGTEPIHWAPQIALGPAWHHVDVCFDFVQATRTIVVDAERTTQTGVSRWPSPGEVDFGLPYVIGPSSGTRVQIDNLLVDLASCP